METGLQKIKQPEPSVASMQTTQYQGKKYKVIPSAKTGVIQAPKTSSTPLLDWVEIKRKENPRMKYKVTFKNYNLKNIQTKASIAVFTCGLLSLIKLFKK